MSKSIALEKLNGLLANVRMEKAFCATDVVLAPGTPMLKKIVLREKVGKLPVNIPFYAFVRNCGEDLVLAPIEKGDVLIVKGIQVASETMVRDNEKFRLNGVNYGLKDRINGCPRYRPVDTKPRK